LQGGLAIGFCPTAAIPEPHSEGFKRALFSSAAGQYFGDTATDKQSTLRLDSGLGK